MRVRARYSQIAWLVAAMCASSFLSVMPHGIGELLAVIVAALVGLLVGVVAIGRPGTSPQSALIVTLGLAIFAYAVEVLVWGDQPRSFAGLPGAVDVFGTRVQTHYLMVIGVTVPVFAGMAAFFARTDVGKALTACASNPYAARVVGIDVRRMGSTGSRRPSSAGSPARRSRSSAACCSA